MKRELKVGMKFLLPITITQVFSDGSFFMRTDGCPGADRKQAIGGAPRDLDGLIPKGGWPREPFTHGDVVRLVGVDSSLTWTVWGSEVDGKIMLMEGVWARMNDASFFELVPQ